MATGCSRLGPHTCGVCTDHTDSPAIVAIDAELFQFEFFFVTVVVRHARKSRSSRHTWNARHAWNARDAWSSGNARRSR